MNRVTIVTAFFDIGRKDFKAIPRTNDRYLNDFKFWASIKNDLIIFADEAYSDAAIKIRADYGLADKTHLVTIKDISSIEPSILLRMEEIGQNGWFTRFRTLPNATSNIPIYSYLMLLKGWFMKEAVRRFNLEGSVVWMDFGFNHGGALYNHSEDFAFEWKQEEKDKIQLFYYKVLDEKPIYEIVRRLSDSIMGALYIIPAKLCSEFWNLTKSAMEALLDVGLYDDDQLLLLMASRKRPDLFIIEESDWFLPVKTHGNPEMRLRRALKRPWYKQFIVDARTKIKRARLALRASIITFNDLLRRD